MTVGIPLILEWHLVMTSSQMESITVVRNLSGLEVPRRDNHVPTTFHWEYIR